MPTDDLDRRPREPDPSGHETMTPWLPPSGPPGRSPESAGGARPSLRARLWRRRWIIALWTVLLLLAVSGFWAQRGGGGAATAVRVFAYLVLCLGVLVVPGFILEASGLAIERRRIVAMGVLIGSATLAVVTIFASLLSATPPLILLAGNALWTLDTIDLELEQRERERKTGPRPGS